MNDPFLFFRRTLFNLQSSADIKSRQRSHNNIENRYTHKKSKHAYRIKQVNYNKNNGMNTVSRLDPFT